MGGGVVEKVSCFTFNLKSDNQKEKPEFKDQKSFLSKRVEDMMQYHHGLRQTAIRQAGRQTDERTYRYQMMLMFLFGWLRWLSVCLSSLKVSPCYFGLV